MAAVMQKSEIVLVLENVQNLGRRPAFLFQSSKDYLRRAQSRKYCTVFLNFGHGGHTAHPKENDVIDNIGAKDVLGKV